MGINLHSYDTSTHTHALNVTQVAIVYYLLNLCGYTLLDYLQTVLHHSLSAVRWVGLPAIGTLL